MELDGEYRIPASRQAVWTALNDPEVLRECIPGCQELNKLSDTELEAKVKLKIGPVGATFSGKVELQNLNPPESYTIVGQGSGGIAGAGKGEADVSLEETGPEETVLRYNARATVSGKIAQLGQRMITPVAKKLANQFFDKFNEKMGGEAATAGA